VISDTAIIIPLRRFDMFVQAFTVATKQAYFIAIRPQPRIISYQRVYKKAEKGSVSVILQIHLVTGTSCNI